MEIRFVHMGCPERIPVTEEPNADSILPIDDEKWENEVRDAISYVIYFRAILIRA